MRRNNLQALAVLMLIGALVSSTMGQVSSRPQVRPAVTIDDSKNNTRLLFDDKDASGNGFIPIQVGLPLAERSPPSSQVSKTPPPAIPTSPNSQKPTTSNTTVPPPQIEASTMRIPPALRPAAPTPPKNLPTAPVPPAALKQERSAPQSAARAPAMNYAPAPMPPSYGAPPAPLPAYGQPPQAPVKKMPVYQKPKKQVMTPAQAPAYGASPPAPAYGVPPPAPAYGVPAPVPAAPAYGAPSVSPTYMGAPFISSYPAPAPAPAYAPPPATGYGVVSRPQPRPVSKPKPAPVYDSPPAVSYSVPKPDDSDEGIKSKLWGLITKGLNWFKKDELGISDDDAVGYYKDGVWDLFIPLMIIGIVLPVVFGMAAGQGVSFPVPAWVRALANFLNNIFPIKVIAKGRSFESGTSETELNELDRIFHKYVKTVYSDDCIAKIACELGDSFKDYSGKTWISWILEHFVPNKFSRAKVAFLKTLQGDWTLQSCALYKCNTKKLKY